MDAEKLLDRQIATYLMIGKTDRDIHEVEVSVALMKETMDGIEKHGMRDKVCMYCKTVMGQVYAPNLREGEITSAVCPKCIPIQEEMLRSFLERNK